MRGLAFIIHAMWVWSITLGITLLYICPYSRSPDNVFIIGLVSIGISFIVTPLFVHTIFRKEE